METKHLKKVKQLASLKEEDTTEKMLEEDVTEKKPYFWDEISQDEKIERLRKIVKNQSKTIDDLRREIRKFRNHSHGMLGQILVPYDNNSELSGEGCKESFGSRGVYF